MKIEKRLKAFIFTKRLKHEFNQKQKVLQEAAKRDGVMPRLYPNWLISMNSTPSDAAFCYSDGEIFHIFEYDTRDFNHYEVHELEETVCYLLHYYARETAICFAEQQSTVKTEWDRDLALAKFFEYMELLGESYVKIAKERMSSLAGYRIKKSGLTMKYEYSFKELEYPDGKKFLKIQLPQELDLVTVFFVYRICSSLFGRD